MRSHNDAAIGKGRRIYFKDHGWVNATVANLEGLASDATISGPAVLESGFTSIVIDPGAKVRHDPSGTLVIEITA